MRDLDLVVSVAHLSGVDPPATMSTMAMRGSVVRETAEIVAKTVLLARDKQIKDPSIVQQLIRVR
jgi:hypothetical protein